MKQKYVSAVETCIANGHAKLASNEDNSTGWFLPHHPVFHPRKPEKLRVVFDCAARFYGSSLNDQLSWGPDFLNALIGVLTRFRMEKIAVMGDIEQMFHQVLVHTKDRRYLQFLWWPQGDLTLEPLTYHTNVHLFGAASSPSRAQFSLLESAKDQSDQFDPKAKQIVQRNFYRDDCLFSVASAGEATYLIEQVTKLLQNRGFNLIKWLSNDCGVLKSIPTTKLSNSAVSLTCKTDDLQVCERVLGLLWNCSDDNFQFSLQTEEKTID